MTLTGHGLRATLFATISLLLAACAGPVTETPTEAVKPIGDFKLGILVVYAENAKKGPMSRDATPDELKAAVEAEMRKRFGGLQGKKFYNISVAVDVYALARTGIPILVTPKSALALTVNIWDDAKQKTIFDEDKQFTTVEKISGRSLIGSGLSMTADEQLHELVVLTVDKIEAYMRENEALFIAE